MLAKEFITPLAGVPYFRSVGIIKVEDKKKNKYNVGEVAFERYDDQNFQYVFTPYWKLIEFLPPDIFSGIPGIDFDIKREHYYRVNMTPSFISKRTPSEGRENIKELLKEVELDHYDRFEWLLRTERSCGDDNFVVERKRDGLTVFRDADANIINSIQPGDKIILERLTDIVPNRKALSETMFRLLQSGAEIFVKEDEVTFSVEKGVNLLYVLERMVRYGEAYDSISRKEGIERAKREEKYKGRKRIATDMFVFGEIVEKFESGTISEQQILERLDMSRSTFYRRMKEWRESLHKKQQFDTISSEKESKREKSNG